MEMKKGILIGCGALVALVILGMAAFIVMASYGPETFVVSGRQLPNRYLKTLKGLGLLEDGEKVAFFYSDAFMDIRSGLYFTSDKKVAAYCKDWDPPAISVPLDSIIDLSFEQNDSFWEDSVIWIRSNEEAEFSILVSSEGGGDERFYEYLLHSCKNLQSAEPSPEAEVPSNETEG